MGFLASIPSWIGPLIGGGVSAIAGGLGNTQDARTSTGNQSGSQRGSSSSTYGGGTNPTYSSTQTALQQQVGSDLSRRLSEPVDVSAKRIAGTDQINKTYKGLGDRLTQSLAGRGFGASGLTGSGLLETEIARAGALGGLENDLLSYAQDQQNRTLEQALQFAFRNPGTVSSGGSDNSSSSTSTSAYTGVAPGSAGAGAIGAGLAGFQAIQNLMNARN